MFYDWKIPASERPHEICTKADQTKAVCDIRVSSTLPGDHLCGCLESNLYEQNNLVVSFSNRHNPDQFYGCRRANIVCPCVLHITVAENWKESSGCLINTHSRPKKYSSTDIPNTGKGKEFVIIESCHLILSRIFLNDSSGCQYITINPLLPPPPLKSHPYPMKT